jgi:mandelate racemase
MNTGLSIRAIKTLGVDVPMRRPLVTSVQTIRSAPLCLFEVVTAEGIVGRSYLFCYMRRMALAAALVTDEAAGVLAGKEVAPLDVAAALARHFRLVGATGLANLVASGIDMACWDALAQAQGRTLAALLGSGARPIRAYNSCGLGMSPIEQLADEAEQLLEGGFTAVKIRLGRPRLEDDLAAVRSVRKRLGDDVALMADFNQALSATEALRRCRALDGEGLYWIEEPIRHDDYAGCSRIARAVRTPIQIGENFVGPRALAAALKAGACDFVMPDVERIGGVTGWMQAAALASAGGVEVSSHLMPEISAQLLCATSTCHWLEYVDWADPILQQPLQIVKGHALISNRAGSGIAWDPSAVERFRIQ